MASSPSTNSFGPASRERVEGFRSDARSIAESRVKITAFALFLPSRSSMEYMR